jgi:hypothetical protein
LAFFSSGNIYLTILSLSFSLRRNLYLLIFFSLVFSFDGNPYLIVSSFVFSLSAISSNDLLLSVLLEWGSLPDDHLFRALLGGRALPDDLLLGVLLEWKAVGAELVNTAECDHVIRTLHKNIIIRS